MAKHALPMTMANREQIEEIQQQFQENVIG